MLDDLRALARRHDRYGVREEHYASVGAALLWTLEQGLGPDFTPEVQEAWATAYGLLSSAMRFVEKFQEHGRATKHSHAGAHGLRESLGDLPVPLLIFLRPCKRRDDMAAAILAFSVQDAAIKWLSRDYGLEIGRAHV